MTTRYILDVRSSTEYAMGHKSDAVNFDVQRLASGELPNIPKDAPIEVYCASGARSRMATHILSMHGFTNVIDTGGYNG
ncbi:MAG: rhodanese-like domain-containing protein [Candidatus Pacebacteria bacterium]|nr:rhodanese-like domain-containing protein [Candidatus Paceibacterota bacterium]